MRKDFRDIRFRDPSTLKKCAYWIESKTDGSTASVWVKTYLSQKRLHLLYGNGAAVSESSGSAVFDLFDDFSSTLDTTTKWTSTPQSGSIATTNDTLRMTILQAQNASLVSKTSFGENVRIVFNYKPDHATDNLYVYEEFWCSAGGAKEINIISSHAPQYSQSFYNYNGSINVTKITGGISTSAYNRVQLIRAGATGAKWTVDTRTEQTCATNYPNGSSIPVGFRVYGNGSTTAGLTADYIFVAKWTATEPTLTKVRSGLNRFHTAVRKFRAIVTTSTPTEYSDTIAVTRYLGASITATQTKAPVAAFSADVTSGQSPLTVHLTDESTNSPTEWSWTIYSDHLYTLQWSTDQNPTFVLTYPGVYTVQLEVSNAAGDDAELKEAYITVLPSPNAVSVTATRYLGGSIAETGGTVPVTTGYSFIVDGEDYTTANIINLTIRDRLNQLPRFDFRAHSLATTDLDHFRAGATVVVKYNGVRRCEGFVERFDNQQSSYFYDCTGYGVGHYLDYRRSDVPTYFPVGLQGENTVKDIVTYVINTSCGFPTTGTYGWTVEGDAGPDLLIYKIQNQKAMEHLAQLMNLADMDWRAGMNGAGYTLTLNPTPVTHTATNLKIGRDVVKAEIVTDLSKVANNIVIQSKDYFGNTIISHIGDYTNVCKVASSETLLKYDAQSGTSLLYVWDHSDYPSSGSLFVSTEAVTYTGKSTPASANHPHFYGLTTTASHVAYEPVLFRDGFYITGATAPFLDADSGTLQVGRERISYASVYSVNATVACVSGTLTRGVATTPIYAHGREAPVFDLDYSLSSPTSTTSVATYGRKDEVISGLGYQDMNSLDLAAYGVLQRKCGPPTWGQAMLVGGDFPTAFPTTPKVGDWISIEDEHTTTATSYRITGLDYDQMRGTITINWGQNEEYAVSDLQKGDVAQNEAMSHVAESNQMEWDARTTHNPPA